MTVPAPRTYEEKAALEAAMRRFREDRGITDTFAFGDLVLRWEKLVSELERGEYSLSFADYIHDLQQRDAIDEIRNALPSRLADELKSYLTHLDERFRFATKETGQTLLDADVCSAFWWWRVPKRVSSEFTEEVASRDF